MERIWILGVTGVGKSTFGKKLSQALGHELIELDDLFWQPNWRSNPDETIRKDLATALKQHDRWIICGNYRFLHSDFMPLTNMLIWLDYSFARCFWQLLKRSIHRSISGQTVCNGNQETTKRMLSKDSILLWLIKSYRKQRLYFHETKAAYPNVEYLRFSNPKQAELWLEKHINRNK